jgi:hypothetical protein
MLWRHLGEWRYSSAFIDLGTTWNGHLHVPAALTPSTHWIGGWLGLRVSLDAVEKSKILHCRESRTGLPGRNPSLYLLPSFDGIQLNLNSQEYVQLRKFFKWNGQRAASGSDGAWEMCDFYKYRNPFRHGGNCTHACFELKNTQSVLWGSCDSQNKQQLCLFPYADLTSWSVKRKRLEFSDRQESTDVPYYWKHTHIMSVQNYVSTEITLVMHKLSDCNYAQNYYYICQMRRETT